MAGYIGSKTVNLSTTGADIAGDADVSGALDVGGAFTSQGIDDNATSTSMTLDASGNVGIGTSSISAPLQVKGSAGEVRLQRPTASQADWSFKLPSSNGELTFYDNNNSSERMRISSTGAVGINVVPETWYTPLSTTALQIGGTTSLWALSNGSTDLRTTLDNNLYVSNGGVNTYLNTGPASRYQQTNGTHRFSTAASGTADATATVAERMRIIADGHVAINSGTVTSVNYTHKLYINDTRTGSVNAVMGLRFGSTGTRRQINFMNPNGIVGRIQTSGSATSYVTSSDYRLKENVVDITDGIERVKQLSPKRFNFIADANLTVDGFIAHEAQTVVPEAIDGVKDETVPIGNLTNSDGAIIETGIVEPEELRNGETWTSTGTEPVYQGIDQSKLVPLLTAALKEALTKIDDLETRLAALEAV